MSEKDVTFAHTLAKEKVVRAAHLLRGQLARNKRRDIRDAWTEIESYLGVSMRVLDRTPITEIKDAAITEEIKARLDGRFVK